MRKVERISQQFEISTRFKLAKRIICEVSEFDSTFPVAHLINKKTFLPYLCAIDGYDAVSLLVRIIIEGHRYSLFRARKPALFGAWVDLKDVCSGRIHRLFPAEEYIN